jgi:hypothetical protein
MRCVINPLELAVWFPGTFIHLSFVDSICLRDNRIRNRVNCKERREAVDVTSHPACKHHWSTRQATDRHVCVCVCVCVCACACVCVRARVQDDPYFWDQLRGTQGLVRFLRQMNPDHSLAHKSVSSILMWSFRVRVDHSSSLILVGFPTKLCFLILFEFIILTLSDK